MEIKTKPVYISDDGMEFDDEISCTQLDYYECPDCGAEWRSEPYSGGQYS